MYNHSNEEASQTDGHMNRKSAHDNALHLKEMKCDYARNKIIDSKTVSQKNFVFKSVLHLAWSRPKSNPVCLLNTYF